MPQLVKKSLSWFKMDTQIRKQLDDRELLRLGESLKIRQLQPVLCNSDGERRFRAAMLVGLTSLEVTFNDEAVTDSEIRILQLTENIQREDLNFKGESFQVTAQCRRRVFGHRIVVLDPFKAVTRTPDTFNPPEFIDCELPKSMEQCRDLAEALVIRVGGEREPHWADSAELLIGALSVLVVQCAEMNDRSLPTIRTQLTDPAKVELAIKLASTSDSCGGLLARIYRQLTQFKDRELGSTLTTTNPFLRFLQILAIAEISETSSFNPADFLGGKMNGYFVLPPEHMRTQMSLLRVWIRSFLRGVVRCNLQERRKAHFSFDEAASVGHMETLEDAVDKYRGYGVGLHFFCQSMSQLRRPFSDGQDLTLLSNRSQVFFATYDYETVKHVSNRPGERTIAVSSNGIWTKTAQKKEYLSRRHVCKRMGIGAHATF